MIHLLLCTFSCYTSFPKYIIVPLLNYGHDIAKLLPSNRPLLKLVVKQIKQKQQCMKYYLNYYIPTAIIDVLIASYIMYE